MSLYCSFSDLSDERTIIDSLATPSKISFLCISTIDREKSDVLIRSNLFDMGPSRVSS